MSHEIDLHGYQVLEAIDLFVNFYNDRVRAGDFRRILVIHGYGSSGEGGAILVRLRKYLAGHSDCLAFECGEHLESGNLGNTLVFPRKALPSSVDVLSDEILGFCQSPKTKSKIVGKFRKHGELKIQASITTLEKQKLLVSQYKGSHKLYQAKPSDGAP